jgi:hypothetical protein
MKALLLVVVAGLTITCSAADKPNFSGEWKMNPSRSNYGAIPPPAIFIRKIVHTEPEISIVEEQSGGTADSTSTRKITTDGKSASFDMNGTPVTASATWEGNELVANSNAESLGLKFKDRMSLSDDGKVLTSLVHVTSNQGNVELTIVFERQ